MKYKDTSAQSTEIQKLEKYVDTSSGDKRGIKQEAMLD